MTGLDEATGRRLATGAPRLLWPAGAELGEGPLWDDRRGLLWWLDIEGRRLHRNDSQGGDRRSWDMRARVGCAALTEAPESRLLLGLESGLHLFDPEVGGGEGALEFLARPDPWPAGSRPNDGKVDGAGRLWFGTMDVAQRRGAGALWRLDRDGRCRLLKRDWTIPDGPAFAPDGALLYRADSERRCVFAFELDPEGEPRGGGPRPFIRVAEDEPGVPDGMAMDAEGCLWLAHNGGGCVVRYGPDGHPMARIPLPARAVASCAFGGADLTTLFVTTAREGAGPDDGAAAGALFAVPTAVRGLPAGRLRLDTWNEAT